MEINDRFDQMRTKSAIDNLVSIAPISPDLHTGIFCDGCNYEIRERRYKCIECGNYDLCFTCEMKKLHSHHMMVRIVEPLSVSICEKRKLNVEIDVAVSFSSSQRPISEIIETIKKRRNATIISGQNTALTVRPLSPDILNQNQSNVYTPGGIRGIDHRLDTDFGPLETVLSSSNRSNTATTSTVTVPDNSSNVPQTDTDICEVLFVPIESAASSNFATAMGTPAPLEPAASSNSPTNNFLYGIARDEQPIIQAERPMTSAESSRLAMLEARNYQHRVIEKRSPPE